MKPVNIGGHAAYRNALRKNLRACYPNHEVILKSQWEIYEKFRDLDLSPVDSIMDNVCCQGVFFIAIPLHIEKIKIIVFITG